MVVENENPSTLAFITLLIESPPADTLRIFLMAADGGEHHDSKVIFFFLLSTLKACVFKVVSCQYFPINGSFAHGIIKSPKSALENVKFEQSNHNKYFFDITIPLFEHTYK